MTTPHRATTSRLNVNLDRSLHRALKMQALNEDTTEAAIVRRLITAYLEEPSRSEHPQHPSDERGAWCSSQDSGWIWDSRAEGPGDGDPTRHDRTGNAPPPHPARAGLPTAPPARRP